MFPTDEYFSTQIAAHPEDESVKLEYANWLEEQNNWLCFGLRWMVEHQRHPIYEQHMGFYWSFGSNLNIPESLPYPFLRMMNGRGFRLPGQLDCIGYCYYWAAYLGAAKAATELALKGQLIINNRNVVTKSEHAFLELIEKDPTDEFSQLMFADWLEETDDPKYLGVRWLVSRGKLPLSNQWKEAESQLMTTTEGVEKIHRHHSNTQPVDALPMHVFERLVDGFQKWKSRNYMNFQDAYLDAVNASSLLIQEGKLELSQTDPKLEEQREQALHQRIDENPNIHLYKQEYAEWLEQIGHPLHLGIRWLLYHKRQPTFNSETEEWMWYPGYSLRSAGHHLPRGVLELLQPTKKQSSEWPSSFETYLKAYLVAARVVSKMLLRGALR